jgi:hypothetical protein
VALMEGTPWHPVRYRVASPPGRSPTLGSASTPTGRDRPVHHLRQEGRPADRGGTDGRGSLGSLRIRIRIRTARVRHRCPRRWSGGRRPSPSHHRRRRRRRRQASRCCRRRRRGVVVVCRARVPPRGDPRERRDALGGRRVLPGTAGVGCVWGVCVGVCVGG